MYSLSGSNAQAVDHDFAWSSLVVVFPPKVLLSFHHRSRL
jgi:hypothetical protein